MILLIRRPKTRRLVDSLKARPFSVTGGGTGIGRGIAIECARHGADVAIHYFNEEEGAESAEQEIRALGRACQTFQADFRRLEDVASLAADAEVFPQACGCTDQQCRNHRQLPARSHIGVSL